MQTFGDRQGTLLAQYVGDIEDAPSASAYVPSSAGYCRGVAARWDVACAKPFRGARSQPAPVPAGVKTPRTGGLRPILTAFADGASKHTHPYKQPAEPKDHFN